MASALASTGLVSEEVIKAVAGGEHLALDVLVDRKKTSDLYTTVIFHSGAGQRLRTVVSVYLSDEYGRLVQIEDRRRLLEWILS